MKTITAAPTATSANGASQLSSGQRYATLGGSWAAWLFDALDATIFSFVHYRCSTCVYASGNQRRPAYQWQLNFILKRFQ